MQFQIMTLTNKHISKVVLFITFLLLNITVASCDSCKPKQKKPQQMEQEKLQQEERLLMGKIKKHYTLDAWKLEEGVLKKLKGDKKLIDIDMALSFTTSTLQGIEELEKEDENRIQEFLELPVVAIALQMLTGVSADPKKNLALIKQSETDMLAILQNFKKQVELK